jgi:hypothetical protein
MNYGKNEHVFLHYFVTQGLKVVPSKNKGVPVYTERQKRKKKAVQKVGRPILNTNIGV